MTGETNLKTLLASMSPVLTEGKYVFCSVQHEQSGDIQRLQPIATVSEDEGLTLLILKSVADTQNFLYQGVFRRITLEVHSSLEAVGLTAAFAAKLTEYGISANVLAGYYHDHIMVPVEAVQAAMSALKELSA